MFSCAYEKKRRVPISSVEHLWQTYATTKWLCLTSTKLANNLRCEFIFHFVQKHIWQLNIKPKHSCDEDKRREKKRTRMKFKSINGKGDGSNHSTSSCEESKKK